MTYLSPAYYSNMYSLTETVNTIENIHKYILDVTENKKEGRFLLIRNNCSYANKFIYAHTNQN